MKYRVHLDSHGYVNFRFNADVDEHRWLTNEPEVICECDSLDEAEMVAYSHLGRDPTDTAFISLDDGRLLNSFRCDLADKERERLGRRIGMLFGLLVLCIVGFSWAAVFGQTRFAFIAFFVAAGLFSLIALLGIQNQFESLLVSLLVEAIMLIVGHVNLFSQASG